MISHMSQYQAELHLPANLTEGWAGVIDNNSPGSLLGFSTLDETLRDWYVNRSLKSNIFCEGVCEGPVAAAGIDVNYSTSK